MTQFMAFNGAMPTTAAPVTVTTGTVIKTLQQLKTGTVNPAWIKAWHISFKGFTAAEPIKCELVHTGTVAATVTAYAAADVQPWGVASVPVSTMSNGTSASGYTASAEGSITATKHFDLQYVSPTSSYTMLWPLGDEPMVGPGEILRIRVTAPAAVDAYSWIRWME